MHISTSYYLFYYWDYFILLVFQQQSVQCVVDTVFGTVTLNTNFHSNSEFLLFHLINNVTGETRRREQTFFNRFLCFKQTVFSFHSRRLLFPPGSPISTMFLSPGVTPWKTTLPGVVNGANNPGIRVFEYDTQTLLVKVRQKPAQRGSTVCFSCYSLSASESCGFCLCLNTGCGDLLSEPNPC